MMEKRCKAAFLAASVLALAGAPSLAQTAPPPVVPAAQPDPAFDGAKAAFDALPEAERRAIQDALVWTGDHVGVVSGAFGRRTFEAIAAYQKRAKLPSTGALDPKARGELLAAAQREKDALQFKVSRDPRSGAEIGVPEKLLPRREANGIGGTRWQSPDGRITLDTRSQAGAETDLVALYERNLAIQAPDRRVTYKVQRPDFFVITGETATGKFYTRAAVGPGGIRGFSLGYDKGLAKEFDRTVIAVANSFNAFPAHTPAVAAAPAAPTTLPVRPPAVEPARPPGPIATGLTVAPRRLLTSAAVAGCPDLRAAGAPARLLKADRATGLAVLETDPARPGPAGATAAPVALRAAPPAAGEEWVVLSYSGGSAPANLTVAPGEAGAADRVFAPLQPGAAGAPVLDRSGALVGLVASLPAVPVAVAGVVPPMSHPLVGAGALAGEIGPAPPADAAGPMSAGALSARLRAFLVPIECAR